MIAWKDLSQGQQGPNPLCFGPISRSDIVRYQGASGDFQPIHHDEPFARSAGYHAPLVVGMYPAGAMQTWATNWLGPENIRKTKMRWKEQVWPGDTLTISGKVSRKYQEEEKMIDLEMVCLNQDGRTVIQGWATFVVHM
jgi:acyl dehydratase